MCEIYVMKILVVYASRGGSTQAVAQTIAATLNQQDLQADMRFLRDVTDLRTYDVVVLGAPIRMGKWVPEAVQFVKTHQKTLQQKQFACFVVCMTLKDDTAENRADVEKVLDEVKGLIQPVDVGLFAGALTAHGRLKSFWIFLAKLLRVPQGDYRDYGKIAGWAKGLARKLS